MRKTVIGALLSTFGAAVLAQGSVTVYGALDAYLGYGKSGSTFRQTRLGNSGHSTSRLGFYGSEDLGGGLRASFQLEAGISADTGSGTMPGPSLSFTRQSWVGLSGDWGSLQLGRQYTPLFLTTVRPDPLGANGVFSPVNLWAQVDGQGGLLTWAAWADNAVLYTSPRGLPLSGLLMVAPGEATTPASSSGRYVGGSLSYESGPIYVGYGVQQRKSGSAAAPVASPSTSTAHAVAASYRVPRLWVGASYGIQDSDVATVNKATIINVHGQYHITLQLAVVVSYGLRDVARSGRDQSSLLIGCNYWLSRRTGLYARLLFLKNRGNASVSLGGVTVAPDSGNDASLFGVGVLHHF